MTPTLAAYAQRVERMSHAQASGALSSYNKAAAEGRIPPDLREELDAMCAMLKDRAEETGGVIV